MTTEPSNQDSAATVILSADSQLLRPRQFLRTAGRSLRASLGVARHLLARDLKARYRQTLLGYFWLVAPSLAVTGIWLILNSSKIINTGDTGLPYPIFLLLGTVLWQAFVDAINSPLQQISMSTSLITKVNFPIESVILSGFGMVILNAIIRLILVLPVLAFYDIQPSRSVVLVPIGLAALVVAGFAIGLALVPLGALYQDIPQGLTVALSFLFLITPVVYESPPVGAAKVLAVANPISILLGTTRGWFTGAPAGPTGLWFVYAIAASLILGLSWLFLRLAVPHLVDRIGT